MIRKDWHGLMKILEIKLIQDDKVIWEANNLLNTFHLGGEQRILQYVFAGESLPAAFYIGLDSRPTPLEADTLASLVGEPTSGGYTRQAVAVDAFAVGLVSGVYQATSPIVTFSASLASTWGPVTNIFLCDTANNSGVLFATASLNQTITVSNGNSVTMRMGMALRDCP
jgi:hypothetical protein